jgi:iron-sulfur cluster repair di-iron protein
MNSTPLNQTADVLASDAARQEVLSALNELLEAERAGARVAMETGREIAVPELALLVEDIHRDEVRWCSLLMRTIKSFGATPSSATGAFWGKAMAIPDVDERLKFLNRGQAWVVRKLEALIPRIEVQAVREDLTAMLQAHRHNIDRVESRFASEPLIDSPRTTEEPPPSDASALVAYILRRFHEVHRRQLPELIQLANKVETVHDDHPSVPRGLAVMLEQIHSELLDHMAKEEGVLFPMLARGGGSFVTHPICVMMSEHEEHGRRLAQLMALTCQATPPEDACRTWVQLCSATRQFADDLQQHIRLENEVLFPQFDPSLPHVQESDSR